MAQRADTFDLGRLALVSGEGCSVDLEVPLQGLEFGSQRYEVEEGFADAHLDVSRTASGFALRLRFAARLQGPCMRCLEDADEVIDIDAREIDQPGGGEDLESEYVEGIELAVASWAHDALALVLPTQIVCREACKGLCPICGENLNEARDDHHHEPEPDPRWAKLSELKLD